MAAGALAAVYDGQDHGLALAAVALQAEEPDRGVGVQAVAAALAHRLQVGLLSDGRRRSEVRGAQEESSTQLTKKPRHLERASVTPDTRKSQRQKHFASW